MKTIKENLRKSIRFGIFPLAVCAVLINSSCTPRALEKPPAANAPANENKLSALESDLQTMRTADLKYIFVFRRKDNAPFDGEDKKFLRANLSTTNRIVLSDDGKAFVIGSNYEFPPENSEILRARFNVEDFSGVR